MQTEKTQYKVLKDEFHGLLVIARKESKEYKIYVSPTFLEKNHLTFWQDADYYNDFLDRNIDGFIEGIINEDYRMIYDGFYIE